MPIPAPLHAGHHNAVAAWRTDHIVVFSAATVLQRAGKPAGSRIGRLDS